MFNKKKIAIVGLGYVGLPLAVEFSKYYDVIGFDINKKRISDLQNGEDKNNEVQKNKFSILSLEQLIRLEELVKKKDYSHEKKANKSKAKLLKQINVEIYKRDDSAIWK